MNRLIGRKLPPQKKIVIIYQYLHNLLWFKKKLPYDISSGLVVLRCHVLMDCSFLVGKKARVS